MLSQNCSRILDAIEQLLHKKYKNTDEFLSSMLQFIKQTVDFDVAFVALADNSTQQLELLNRSIVGAPINSATQLYVRCLPIGGNDLPKRIQSVTGRCAYSEKPVRVGSINSCDYYKASNPSTLSELAIPIIWFNQLLGVINLESNIENYYSDEHERYLVIVASLIARALDGLLQREGLQQPVAKILDDIRQISNRLSVNIPIEKTDILNDIAIIVATAFNCDNCSIWLLDKRGDKLVLGGSAGQIIADKELYKNNSRDTRAWRVIDARESMTFCSAAPIADNEVLQDQTVASSLVCPLLYSNRAIGVIELGSRKRSMGNPHGNFNEVDEHVISIVQGQVANLIRLSHSEIERRNKEESIEKLLPIFAEVDVKSVAENIVLEIPKYTNAINCSIFIWDPSRKEFVLLATKGLDKSLVGIASYKPGEGLTGWVGQNCWSLILDARTDKDLEKISPGLKWKHKYNEGSLECGLETRPFIAVPVMSFGECLGVIRICDRTSGYFDKSDEHILKLAAAHLAAAIRFCDRYGQTVRLAENMRELQSTITDDELGNILNSAGDQYNELGDTLTNLEKDIAVKAVAAAKKIFQPDIVTLHLYDSSNKKFLTPPIIEGAIKNIEVMNMRVYPDDVPFKVLQNGTTYWENCAEDEYLTSEIPVRDGVTSRPRFVVRENIQSSVGLRLEVANVPVGIMFLNYHHANSFDVRRKSVLDTFAKQIAIIINAVRLYRTVRQSTSREEASYFAMEMHDSPLQILSAIMMQAGTAKQQLSTNKIDDVQKQIRLIEKAAKHGIEEIHSIIGMMNTHIVDDFGLESALKDHIECLDHSSVSIELNIHGEQFIPLSIQRHLYRIAQEGIANAVKHATAKQVVVKLDANTERFDLKIIDDGNGFKYNEENIPKDSYGLRGIAKRTKAMFGKLGIKPRESGGTELHVTAALPNAIRQHDMEEEAISQSDKIRVFVLDDETIFVEGVQKVLEATDDLVFSGYENSNTHNLVDKIKNAKADVVVVDLALRYGVTVDVMKAHPKWSGVAAIRTIREQLGNKIKIMVYTNTPSLFSEAKEAGADACYTRSLTTDEFISVIREINNGNETIIDGFDINNVKGVEINNVNLEIVLVDIDENRMVPVKLQPAVFSLLWYLCLERSLGQKDWIIRESGRDNDYIMKHEELWMDISRNTGSAAHIISGESIRQRLAKLSKSIKDRISVNVSGNSNYLIQRPDHGPMRNGQINRYTLKPSIKQEMVKITGHSINIDIDKAHL